VHGIFWVELSLHARRNPEFGALYDDYVARILEKLDAVLLMIFKTLDQPPPTDIRLISTMIRNVAQGSVLSVRDCDSAAILQLAIRSVLGL
jgi:hypothetical protein